jgi:hypothetical protein
MVRGSSHGVAVLLVALAMALAGTPAWASLRATLESSTIHEHETVRLTVRVLGDGGPMGEPDFSQLEDDFEILSTRTSSEFSSIGGRIQSWTAWIMTLQPKRTGRIEIPAFNLGGHQSEPIELTVSPLDHRTRSFIDDQLFFETELSAREVYVQAQLLLRRTLYYAEGVQLFGELPREPEISFAMVQPLGEAEIARTTRNGQRYRVIEQRYAIFPERSGQLVIPSVAIAGSAVLPRTEGFSGRRAAVDARSDELRIAVLPVPRDYPAGVPWFPAAEVELLESWDQEPPAIDVGKPITRALIVRAEEAMASMVPPLRVDYPAPLRLYAERPDLHESASRNGVVGTRVQSGSVVGQAPGTVELPAVQLTWFDTRTRSIRQVSVPARTLDVRGAAAGALGRWGADPQGSASVEPVIVMPRGPSGYGLLLLLASIAVLAGLWHYRQRLYVGAWMLSKRVRVNPEREVFGQLKLAAERGNAAEIHSVLCAWLQLFYRCPERPALQAFTRDPRNREALDALNAALYAPPDSSNGAHVPRGHDAQMLMRAAVATRAARGRPPRRDPLPALYPDWSRISAR